MLTRSLKYKVGAVTLFNLLMLTVSSHGIHAAEEVNKVEIISPAPGSTIVPERDTIIMRFTGPQALKSNVCDTSFRFWMTAGDSTGRSALFARTYNLSTDQGLVLMEGHTSKAIANGVECSIDFYNAINSRSDTNVSDMKDKADWGKIFLEDHSLPSDSESINKFVDGWKYLVANPSAITKVTFSSLGLNHPFILAPVTFKAISGAPEISAPMLTRGATISTGTPVIVKYSGAPNEAPASVALFISGVASTNSVKDCFLQSIDPRVGERVEIIYACRIPRVHAPGQVEVSVRSTDLRGWVTQSPLVAISVVKSATESLSIEAKASLCKDCALGTLRVTGQAFWNSDVGPIPLLYQNIFACAEDCPRESNATTDGEGKFSVDLKYIDDKKGTSWTVAWSVSVFASVALEANRGGYFTFTRPVIAQPIKPKKSAPSQPVSNVKISLTTKNKINWGDTVVGKVRATGSGTATCIAQFQEELVTFSIKAGQSKTIRIEPGYADNKKFAFNVGCGANANWWGRFFDPRYSWNYAYTKDFKNVTMVVPSNLDGY